MTEVRVLAMRRAPSDGTALYRATVELDGLMVVGEVLVATHGLLDSMPTAQPPIRASGRPLLTWGSAVSRAVATAVIEAAPMMLTEEVAVPAEQPAPDEICPVCLGDWMTCGHTREQAEAAIVAQLQQSEGPDAAA